MIKEISITLFCILFSLPALSKKMFKFQDEKGHWVYTDKKPENIKKFDVSQMNATEKRRIWLEESKSNDTSFYSIRSEIEGPVEIKVLFTEAENVRSIPDLPSSFIVNKGLSKPLFRIDPINSNKNWKFSIKYTSVIGIPMANYVSTTSYYPPIEKNKSFKISQAFNGKSSHHDDESRYAVDIAMPIGTPVYAAREGTVILVNDDFYKTGWSEAFLTKANSILILHSDNSMATYGHLELEKAQVYAGMKVKARQLIAYSGNTGYSSGPHLHFALLYNNGTKLISTPFSFMNENQQTEEPIQGNFITGI